MAIFHLNAAFISASRVYGSEMSFNLNDLVPHDEITECGTYEFTDIDDWRLDEMIKSAVAFIRSQPGHPT